MPPFGDSELDPQIMVRLRDLALPQSVESQTKVVLKKQV